MIFVLWHQANADATLQVLTRNFALQSEAVQKNVLRQIGLTQMEGGVSFLIQVALLPQVYEESIRRDALKNLLAFDSDRFRVVLSLLQKPQLDDISLIETIRLICSGGRCAQAWVESVDFNDTKFLLDAKMAEVYALTARGETIDPAWMATWDKKSAIAYLTHKIETEKDDKYWKKIRTLLNG
ncbi:MAG: hypothetical protein KDD46_06980 [Bdellovibrionales bacterium]|nr:hypothetical protein [Bdellovibrionales bacterium]